VIHLLKRLLAPIKRADKSTAKSILKSSESRKALILYLSQILGIGFAFLTQKINTNALTKEEFGAIAWCTQLLIVLHPLVDFGFFSTGARVLAETKEKQTEKQIYGLLIIILSFLSFLFTVALVSFTYVFPYVFPDKLVYYGMTVSSFFAWAYVIQFFIQSVLQGSGDTPFLSLYTLLTRFFTLFLLFIFYLQGSLSVTLSLLLSSVAMSVCGIYILWKLKAKFSDWRKLLPEIKKRNIEYGWHIFVGKLVTAPTMQLAPLLVPYFGGVAGSALYAVGSNLVTPMVQATQSISTSLFKNFAQQRKLKDRLILINFLVLVFIGVLIYTFSPFLIELSANKNYFAALPYMIPLILGGFFQGMWQPFHLFSLARGNGKWIKQQQIVASIIDLISTLILIPYYGVAGAYWQFFLSRCIRFFLTLHNYYRTVKYIDSSVL